MKIATIDAGTGKAVIEERPDPANATQVLAASVNPIDLVLAGGKFPLRSFSPGDALGYGGVAERSDGTRVYFYDPTPPAGSFAEKVDLGVAKTIPLPDGLDPALGAALGVPGMAAYAATVLAGNVQPDETMLVTGAAGSVGMIAGQVAVAKGAKVVGVVRKKEDVEKVESVGMTGLVQDDNEKDIAGVLRGAAPDGVDLVVDSLWGQHPERLIPALNHRARWVQVGSSAGDDATLKAPVFRNKLISIIGHTNFLLSPDEAGQAYGGVADLAAAGTVRMTFETIGLDDLPEVWAGLVDKSRSGKYVVTF